MSISRNPPIPAYIDGLDWQFHFLVTAVAVYQQK